MSLGDIRPGSTASTVSAGRAVTGRQGQLAPQPLEPRPARCPAAAAAACPRSSAPHGRPGGPPPRPPRPRRAGALSRRDSLSAAESWAAASARWASASAVAAAQGGLAALHLALRAAELAVERLGLLAGRVQLGTEPLGLAAGVGTRPLQLLAQLDQFAPGLLVHPLRVGALGLLAGRLDQLDPAHRAQHIGGGGHIDGIGGRGRRPRLQRTRPAPAGPGSAAHRCAAGTAGRPPGRRPSRSRRTWPAGSG